MTLFHEYLPRINGKVRLLHAAPNAKNVDIYADKKLLYSNLAFGSLTNYIDIPANTYQIEVYEHQKNNKPLISESVTIAPGSIQTISVTYEDKMIAFFTTDDSEPLTNKLLSFVRFINLSPTSPPLSLRLPAGTVMFNESPYLETNAYYPLSPGIYNFVVQASDGSLEKYINNVRLRPGLFITIYIVGLIKGSPRIGYILTKDGNTN